MYRWVNVFGTAMAAWLDEHDMPGAMHRGRFDDWYPGFVDHVNNFRNTVSFLTETALFEYATPHFYTTSDFPPASQDLRSQIFYSSPWRGGWWRLGDAVRYTLASSMAVLDTAARNREELLFDRYRAGRDVIARFAKDPPYAYIIPREQRDTPTAATLVEKLMVDGIEVHQATHEFKANGGTYKEGDWVVFMDQPFAALVKELFDIQKYPNLPGMPQPAAAGAAAAGGGRGGGGGGRAATPAAATPTAAAATPAGGRGGAAGGRGAATPGAAPATPVTTPYDVTGWTLPIQMGVEIVAVTQPIGEATRGLMHKIERVEPIAGKVEGAGPMFAFSRATNASLRAVNEILAAGGTVSFAKSDGTVYATNAAAILKQNGVDAKSVSEAPDAWPVKKPRIGIYQPWSGNIDEGWTRWILEQYRFPFTVLHNPEIRDGHLRDQFDTIVFAEMNSRQIMDGAREGSVPGQYAGGIGEEGAQALRDFVTAGGTVVTLGNAASFAIDQFNLAVSNALAGLRTDQFFCSGSLLRVEIPDQKNPLVAGLPAMPAVMFERNQAFDTRPAFRGKVLASYVKDRNPLVSGYLFGAEQIQGKAAALDANYGSGHIVIIGFRPQWRGQSHGTYKFLFNALYYNSSMAADAGAGGGRGGGRGGGGNPQQTVWRREAESVKTELNRLADLNRTYFAARGPAAAEPGKQLEAALDAFQRDRIPLLDDLRAQVEDAAIVRAEAAWSAQLKRLAADLRTKDFSAVKQDDLLEQYKLVVVP
jgi:hypothetical protein